MFSKVIIPEYAMDYKKEYLFIRGLNKEFEYFTNKLDDLNKGLFESKLADRIKFIMKRFLRGQEKGKIKDIGNLMLQRENVENLIYINEEFGYYKVRWDAFCDNDNDNDNDSDSDGEYIVDGKPYPGFKEFYDIFKKNFNQINKDCYSDDEYDDYDYDYNIILPNSDTDSDDDDF